MLLVGDISMDVIVAPERPREDSKRENGRARAGFDDGLVLRPGLILEHLERCAGGVAMLVCVSFGSRVPLLRKSGRIIQPKRGKLERRWRGRGR